MSRLEFFSGPFRSVLKASVTVICFALLSGSLNADLVFNVGGGALQPSENLMFSPGLISTGTMIEGMTNSSGKIFEVISNDVPQKQLTTPTRGPIRIESVNGAFSSIILQGQNNSVFFTQLEFDVRTLRRSLGTFQLSVMDQNGNTFLDNFSSNALGPGSNYFSVESTNGMLMRSATLTASADIIQDVRHVRISTAAIPEPAAAGLLAVVGMLGATTRRRRV
jgi:hypothetical protein